MRITRRALIAIVVAASSVLAACGDLVDIDRRALVVGVGLDPASGGKPGYEVTVEYPQPSGGAGGGDGGGLLGGGGMGGSLRPKAISASGVNVGAALDEIRPETSRFIYFGNVGVIVIGDALARQGVMAPLDYFLRHGQVAESVQLAVANGGAAPLLSAQAPEGVGLPMFEFLRTAERVHNPTAPNPLWRFMSMIDSRAQASWLPVMEPSAQGQAFVAGGAALFRNGRMVAELDHDQAETVDWLVKKSGFPDDVMSLPGASGMVTLKVSSIRRRWRVLAPDRAQLTLRVQASIREGYGLVLDDRDVTQWNRAASSQMQEEVEQILTILQQDGTDILGLADRVHARYPEATADWPSAFSQMQIALKVQVTINEGGRET